MLKSQPASRPWIPVYITGQAATFCVSQAWTCHNEQNEYKTTRMNHIYKNSKWTINWHFFDTITTNQLPSSSKASGSVVLTDLQPNILIFYLTVQIWMPTIKIEDHFSQVRQSHYRPGQGQRVPGGWGSQIYRQSAHEGGNVSPMHRPPLSPGNIPGTYFCSRPS